MESNIYLKTGNLLFAIPILAIGFIHLMNSDLLDGILPLTPYFPGRMVLTCITGILFIIAGILMLTRNYAYHGTSLTTIILLVILVFVHLPKLVLRIRDTGEWASAFEICALYSGGLIMASFVLNTIRPMRYRVNNKYVLLSTGKYIFAASMLVFGVLHYLNLQSSVSLMPAWIPGRFFVACTVTGAFFAAAKV